MVGLDHLKDLTSSLLAEMEQRLAMIDQLQHEIRQKQSMLEQDKSNWEQIKTAQQQEIALERHDLEAKRKVFEDEKQLMMAACARPSDILTLNVGGEKIIQRRRSTLCAVPGTFLEARFSGRWEQDIDQDEHGRYFINYSPDLFMPLLDYLSMKETEVFGTYTPLPQKPESPEFAAMMHFFGFQQMMTKCMFNRMMSKCLRNLDASSGNERHCTSAGFAFLVHAPTHPVALVSIEISPGYVHCTDATVWTCEGTLPQVHPSRDLPWHQVGTGLLQSSDSEVSSQIDLTAPIFLNMGKPHWVFISTKVNSGFYKASGWKNIGDITAQNNDLQIYAGFHCDLHAAFGSFEFTKSESVFFGKLNYNVAEY